MRLSWMIQVGCIKTQGSIEVENLSQLRSEAEGDVMMEEGSARRRVLLVLDMEEGKHEPKNVSSL